jgi:hypothetical protein
MKHMFAAAVVAAGSLLAASASAATLSGTFDLASQGNVQVGPTYIDWGEVGPVFGPTDGDVLFTFGTGDFGAGGAYNLISTLGGLKDLNLLTAPVNTPLTIENFLTSDAHSNLDFTLTFLAAGSGTAAGCGDVPGTVCTPFVGSPFTIVNGQPLPNGQIGSGVTVNMSGLVSDGSGDPASFWSAAFTTQFATMSSGEILAMIDDEGFVESSYSAQFVVDVTPVPEPASMVLTGLALSGMAMVIRRRRA